MRPHLLTFISLVFTCALVALPATGQDNGHADHSAQHEPETQAIMPDHMVEATGTVNAFQGNTISLSHGPIPALGWDPMTMVFPLGDEIDVSGISQGDRVQFTLHMADDGGLPVVGLCETSAVEVIDGLCPAETPQGAGHEAHGGNHEHQ